MITLEDLKKIYLLQNLKDDMLERMVPMVKNHQFDERDIVFEEGQKAEQFYMLKQGKILLEVEVSEMIIISLGSIKSGYSFGWSALIPGSAYTSYAVCSEPCEVLSVPGSSFLGLLHQDHTFGFVFMEGVVKILKNRLERRTAQFVRVMSKHPDIQKLLGL
jgi:CRP-like cAMP-binding protein